MGLMKDDQSQQGLDSITGLEFFEGKGVYINDPTFLTSMGALPSKQPEGSYTFRWPLTPNLCQWNWPFREGNRKDKPFFLYT